MNLRWLLGNFADPQYKLSRREQWELSRLAHEKYMPGRVFFGWTALALLVPVGSFSSSSCQLASRPWACRGGTVPTSSGS